MRYYSQFGQDRFIHQSFFKARKGGMFIEFGALDGLLDSNTLFFERELSWRGILIEPNPVAFAALQMNRPNCYLENIAICNTSAIMPFLKINGELYGWSGLRDDIEPQHLKRIEQHVTDNQIETINVSTRDLSWLAEKYSLDRVDFMSIDTEGSENKIMRAFPWDRLHVSVFCIENNFANYEIDHLMMDKGYRKCGRIGSDDIYTHRDMASGV